MFCAEDYEWVSVLGAALTLTLIIALTRIITLTLTLTPTLTLTVSLTLTLNLICLGGSPGSLVSYPERTPPVSLALP